MEIDLTNELGAKNWLMILGENGVGKTTILRCIALGLCEQSGAAGLCAEVTGDWIRTGAEKGIIRLEMLPTPGYASEAYVETVLERSLYNETKLTQVTFPETSDQFDWTKLFVCGYGSARSIYGSMDVSEYSVTDSVYSLFNYNADLQNPELCIRRLTSEKINKRQLFEKLEEILMLKQDSIDLTKNGIVVNGPWGNSMQIGTLGDGYRSMLTWLLDLYGWKLLAEEDISDIELEGIVIIDEIEKHLHPKWQKQLIGLLSKQFPNIQFIASTHSPLCVIGTTEIPDSNCCIAVSRQTGSAVETLMTTAPRGKRADQVLTSYLFDLYTTGDNEIQESIGQYKDLYQKKDRTAEEEKLLKDLFVKLEKVLGSAETDMQKKVEDAVSITLKNMSNEAMNKIEPNDPYIFEIKRQLQELFSE